MPKGRRVDGRKRKKKESVFSLCFTDPFVPKIISREIISLAYLYIEMKKDVTNSKNLSKQFW